MAFRGWPVEAIEFFEGLEADNSKAYWEAHKEVYQQAVRAPMDELLGELAPAFGTGKVFRPYRDVRFSADKSPYKTNIAATVGEAGYVTVSAAGLGAGSGLFHMASDQLDRYRRAVADEGTGRPLEAITADLQDRGCELIGHGVLKTAPKGYARDHPRIDLLRWKGLTAWRQWEPGAWLGTKKAKGRIVETLEAAEPLNRWLGTNVGPSTMVEGEGAVTDREEVLPPSDEGAYHHWVTDTVRFSDQDANGHINNVAMAAYVETGRLAFGRVMHSSGRADTDFLLARLAIDYRAEGHYPGEIRVGTRVLSIGRTSATLGHGVFKDGVLLASAECVIVHRREGRNTPIEGEMRARVEGLMRPPTEGTG